jgi:hypothetical protein
VVVGKSRRGGEVSLTGEVPLKMRGGVTQALQVMEFLLQGLATG